MNKMLCIALAGIFVIFLVLGILLNTQQGLRFEEGAFWSLKSGGRYQHGRDWIQPLGDGKFELCLDGQTITAVLTALPDGGMRMDYSDGWAVERAAEDDYLHAFGYYAWTSDSSLILTDMNAAGLQFAAPDHEERMPFYTSYDDTNEHIAGESVSVFSADGHLLDYYEIWHEPAGHTPPERNVILLQNETKLNAYPGYYDSILQNTDGEYLLETHSLGRIPVTGSSANRGSFTYFLLRIGEGAAEARGSISVIAVFILMYCLGAAQMLWPEKLAFWGSRWQYREEPHLSESGLLFARIGGGIVAGMGILLLFVPL